MDYLDELARVYEVRGSVRYEMNQPSGVSQTHHALQCAALAVRAGADETLVGAALLHDLGHLLYDDDSLEEDGAPDDVHQYVVLPFLRPHFPISLLEPIKMHVDAKRYLCRVEPGYWSALSPGSQRSLERQGGPFDSAQAAAFAALPFASEAIALRRWDDQAKDPLAAVPAFDAYRALLARISTTRMNPL